MANAKAFQSKSIGDYPDAFKIGEETFASVPHTSCVDLA
jgi:hypothetical protein